MKNWLLVLAVFISIGCQEAESELKPNTKTKIVNGIERSELALLMRKMYDEMKLVSDSLKDGQAVKVHFLEEFKKISTAHATEPEKIDSLYQTMASAFLSNYELFEQKEQAQVDAFNIMVDNCLVCHQQKCPGPVKTIRKLRIKPTI